mgnify:FL=1|tara:strand:+ start:2437 stop:3291 length:855 start_codon:yes stop_codon:yes gene_type:complete
MRSMTGYTKEEIKIGDNRFSVVIKSLNSLKGLDISIKSPRHLSFIEPDIRKLIEKKIIRGKISLLIIEENNINRLSLNKDAIFNHVEAIKNLIPDAESGSVLNAVMKLPNIFLSEKSKVTLNDKRAILKIMKQALDQLNECRKKEGSALMIVIGGYINRILKISKQLVRLEEKRLKRRKRKLSNQIQSAELEVNSSRLEAEMIYYFERNDITEERIRLNHHCEFFLDVMKTEEVMGKKLIFIAQEILREINTIGSKANDFEIQKRVVQMKEQVEKTKEQLQNIL